MLQKKQIFQESYCEIDYAVWKMARDLDTEKQKISNDKTPPAYLQAFNSKKKCLLHLGDVIPIYNFEYDDLDVEF